MTTIKEFITFRVAGRMYAIRLSYRGKRVQCSSIVWNVAINLLLLWKHHGRNPNGPGPAELVRGTLGNCRKSKSTSFYLNQQFHTGKWASKCRTMQRRKVESVLKLLILMLAFATLVCSKKLQYRPVWWMAWFGLDDGWKICTFEAFLKRPANGHRDRRRKMVSYQFLANCFVFRCQNPILGKII